MKTRYLFVILGTAVLKGAACWLLPANREDHLTRRLDSGPTIENQGSDRAAHPQPRRLLQLRLRDDTGEEPIARSNVAYVALLMNDDDRGIRTLGQSLIDTRTSADLVAILGSSVNKDTEERVRAQGWRIRRLAPVADVGSGLGGDREGGYDVDSPIGSVSDAVVTSNI